MPSNLLINIYIASANVRQLLEPRLEKGAFVPRWNTSEQEFLSWTGENRHRTDCLILQSDRTLPILNQLKRRGILLPTIVISASPQHSELEPSAPEAASLDLAEDLADPRPLSLDSAVSGSLDPQLSSQPEATEIPPSSLREQCTQAAVDYHPGTACLELGDLAQLERYIHQAIDQFLKLPAATPVSDTTVSSEDAQHFVLSLQQQRLTEKLKERLGYLGVYYKRNPEHFLRNLSLAERQEFLQKLRDDYRNIVLSYFSSGSTLNQTIDDFVNIAFFADVSVSQIVEIHMELMDDFGTQLKLEGRSEEILLDYRLTLIDVIAHLCEMYRRSIPREL
ncbi:MAG TPA: circadian clock protein KaiA [Trichocoleus sp.]